MEWCSQNSGSNPPYLVNLQWHDVKRSEAEFGKQAVFRPCVALMVQPEDGSKAPVVGEPATSIQSNKIWQAGRQWVGDVLQ
jgi:hypothetical protein